MKVSGDKSKKRLVRWAFVLLSVSLYGLVYVTAPDKAFFALKTSFRVICRITIPLLIAFTIKFFINLYISPRQMQKLLAGGLGIKGVIFSSLAGILSMGPIFAWYPLLKDFREKGMHDLYLANFLTTRAVKPFLLPVMIYYFGWLFSIVLNIMILLFSPLVAFLTSLLSEKK